VSIHNVFWKQWPAIGANVAKLEKGEGGEEKGKKRGGKGEGGGEAEEIIKRMKKKKESAKVRTRGAEAELENVRRIECWKKKEVGIGSGNPLGRGLGVNQKIRKERKKKKKKGEEGRKNKKGKKKGLVRV